MARLVVYLRYIIFFLIIALFAVQASVAAWNLQIKQLYGNNAQLDAFLIFCGAFGLFVTLPIFCIDLIRQNALFARVWFESAWLGLFFIFEVAGSAALVSALTSMSCKTREPSLRDPACTPTSALTGISWTITSILFLYLCSLLISAVLHQDAYPNVWNTGVRDFPWYEHVNISQRIVSPPCSPIKRSQKPRSGPATTTPGVLAPKPRRPPANPAPIWSSYQVEHYRAEQLAEMGVNSSPSRLPDPPERAMQIRPGATLQMSLYSGVVASSLPSDSRSGRIAVSSTTPLPSRSKRAHPRSTAPESPRVVSSTTPSRAQSQPRGPRSRPPPLDLSQVTSFR